MKALIIITPALVAGLEQKRRLMGFRFSNLQANGSKIEYALQKPFDTLAELPN